jgi:ESS family glutamate:Na+ symporter
MDQPFVISLLVVLGLLLIGFVLRAGIKPLRTLFVPASVVGGLIGLAVMQGALRLGGDGTAGVAEEVADVISGWPGLLIAVVFAGLLMERPGKKFKDAAVSAGRQGIVVWIIVFGEAFVGLLACALLIYPFYDDIPRSFGQLIETGFAGGHGTAAAMGEVYDGLGFAEGRDLAFLFATMGLIYGVISGIFFVNLGVRRGWLRGGPRSEADAARPDLPEAITVPVVTGLENRTNPPPSAFARVRSEVIDPLAFQLCLLGVAFAVGYGLQQAFLAAASATMPADWLTFIGKIPLFLFTLLGGWVTREVMHLLGVGDLIDGPSLHRIGGIAMELLIVAALATLRIETAAAYWLPVLILLVVGFAWVAFCLLYVGRKLLPRSHWFELGLMNYGMSTATTAQGVLLLRIVDRDLDTDAASDYAAAAPLSAPFIGGGVITVLFLPLLLETTGFWLVLPAMALILVALFVAGRLLARRDAGTAST